MVHEITSNGVTLGLIIPGSYRGKDGTQFFTPGDYTQQIAYIHRHAGQKIETHIHNPVPRQITQTQETFIIRKGSVRVDFYDKDRNYVESRVLREGDVYLLVAGGHAFEALEDVEMIEVKQGPYAGDADKTLFSGAPSDQIVIKE